MNTVKDTDASKSIILKTPNILYSVAINETHVAACGETNIHVWSLSSGNLLAILKHRLQVHCYLQTNTILTLVWVDEENLIFGGYDGKVSKWNDFDRFGLNTIKASR